MNVDDLTLKVAKIRVSRTGPDMSQQINFMMKYHQESICTHLETFIYD